jgi:hypothetical protein
MTADFQFNTWFRTATGEGGSIMSIMSGATEVFTVSLDTNNEFVIALNG